MAVIYVGMNGGVLMNCGDTNFIAQAIKYTEPEPL
jgi:hypothetical protein